MAALVGSLRVHSSLEIQDREFQASVLECTVVWLEYGPQVSTMLPSPCMLEICATQIKWECNPYILYSHIPY